MLTFILIIVIAVVILGGLSIFLIYRYPKIKPFLQVFFALCIIVLGYLLVEGILKPIRFNKEVEIREDAAIKKLIDIRTAQVAYKDVHGKFTGSFDTLIDFVKNDSFVITKKDPQPGWDPDVYTEKQAIKKGLIKISTSKHSVLDSLFRKDYPIDKIRYIPYTKENKFEMGAGEVMTGSNVKVKVFEVYALYDSLLNGLDEQLITNYIYEKEKVTKFPGLKVGSLQDATNNAGNWEK